MCGIAGWIAPSRSRGGGAPEEAALHPMLDAISHRGPDGAGTCSFAAGGYQVALGHRRLAIIDPQGSPQPMRDAAAGLALTFNGEIFNFRELRDTLEKSGYRFARDSDTEVLLRAYQHWGTHVVQHLRGQFAFAIWDGHKERLFLARDRFGEKPLYLYESNGYGPRDGCQEIIAAAVASYGIASEDLPDTFDLNMNFVHDCANHRWWIKEPVNEPGDYVEMQAEMDVLVGLSNCPLDVMVPCNAFKCTPLRVEVFEAV